MAAPVRTAAVLAKGAILLSSHGRCGLSCPCLPLSFRPPNCQYEKTGPVIFVLMKSQPRPDGNDTILSSLPSVQHNTTRYLHVHHVRRPCRQIGRETGMVRLCQYYVHKIPAQTTK